MARGTEHAPDALAVSSDSRSLAFVGPSQYIVTIADAQSLDEVFYLCHLSVRWCILYFSGELKLDGDIKINNQ